MEKQIFILLNFVIVMMTINQFVVIAHEDDSDDDENSPDDVDAEHDDHVDVKADVTPPLLLAPNSQRIFNIRMPSVRTAQVTSIS